MVPRYFRIVAIFIVLIAEYEVVNRNTIAVKSREIGGWTCASSHAARVTGCPANSYLPKFSETKLGYLNHIQYRPNPLAN